MNVPASFHRPRSAFRRFAGRLTKAITTPASKNKAPVDGSGIPVTGTDTGVTKERSSKATVFVSEKKLILWIPGTQIDNIAGAGESGTVSDAIRLPNIS